MKVFSEIEIQMAGEKAAGYFGEGFHCAEAVTSAALQAFGEDPTEPTAHATAFGGGFGRTHLEACGALSGALITIGHLYGRRVMGDEWDLPAELGAEIRQRFLDSFGTTHCGALRNGFGEQQMAECRNITKRVTAELLTLLSEDSDQHRPA
jgi:C_GCAxxG_C_C family probable redox protein